MSIRGQDQVEKKYDPLDTTLKFVNREDDLDSSCKICFIFTEYNLYLVFCFCCGTSSWTPAQTREGIKDRYDGD